MKYRRAWVDGFVRTIGAQPAVVIVEPDELAAASCLRPAAGAERIALIRYAARRFSALPRTGVYIDIGAGDWLALKKAATLLRAAGVRYARGFALNATHFDWTANELAYGRRLSRLVGGKHFIVNTAMNGRGPQIRGHNFHVWCNPRGRALGPVPTLHTGDRPANALFWLIEPAVSSGRCNGGPPVGQFWPAWALQLSASASGAPDYPVYRGAASLGRQVDARPSPRGSHTSASVDLVGARPTNSTLALIGAPAGCQPRPSSAPPAATATRRRPRSCCPRGAR